MPNPNPPVILIAREGPVQGFLSGPFVTDVPTGNTKLTTVFGPALDSEVAEFPNAILTCNAGPADWDSVSMSGPDKLHPNAKGSASYAREALRALGRPGWKGSTRAARPS
ncbi:hypothetical protein ASG92_09945 [Arthrobacter sp. Soil736]|uniref:hypothetical protein n=1 Tax=Arthrobacter sp. Soil736 TaxID=1736395 RepID=UPI0006F4E547|nr:hypothetical protein [Arthrobacter sp. Soil736]KRE47555.1 hypothetical protein ASG92_09945 [Arthrobacter sp. Soil736]